MALRETGMTVVCERMYAMLIAYLDASLVRALLDLGSARISQLTGVRVSSSNPAFRFIC